MRLNCVSNLKQIGVGFRLYANDNDGHFPMAVSKENGGTREFTAAGETYRHFLAIGNELSSPKVLICPVAPQRGNSITSFSTNFAQFNNSNIDYFVGLDAKESNPNMLLAGDRNLTTNTKTTGPIMTINGQSRVGWTKELHSRKANEPTGNIGFADGSAQRVNDKQLNQALAANTNGAQRIMLP